jgi:MFS family permease
MAGTDPRTTSGDDGAVTTLWAGLATAAIGDQLYAVALSWIAVGAFGMAAGYLTAIQSLVVLVTALLCGRRADRQEHRRMMIAADLTRRGPDSGCGCLLNGVVVRGHA